MSTNRGRKRWAVGGALVCLSSPFRLPRLAVVRSHCENPGPSISCPLPGAVVDTSHPRRHGQDFPSWKGQLLRGTAGCLVEYRELKSWSWGAANMDSAR